ncbi:VOC family protein [Pseudomonas oryzihabitans]|uniref:Catechol 2,3-dioxygenase-like lactoylglutathione lyase family enzyme n=1 Tax=Pseudomonas oryzihabitans TaxID=47885 RepID=A0AAJ2EZV0_9PSED|nr:VOC family protein [Pseudomonas psychrotolerans]MDR6234825.1 catechol 2,3-dioxygenase-like lactoylglutathione lyase family enzyme [Pseudomonas psychrotolerans]MDR6356001.1 catechol 2,3-dioxygenase-like lactoylglutathione lyase family enzyme [Pseudomonas psychrotolerans]
MTTPRLQAVLETALYATDLARARRFYEEVLGLAPMFADARLAAYAVGASVLLLFQRGTTEQPVKLPGGSIPPHGAQGCQHLALAIAAAELDLWATHLANAGVPIEERTQWPRGAVSLYFRDPDGHLLELVTPGLWPNY